MEQEQKQNSWFNKYYFHLFLIPILIVILCLVYLGYFYSVNNDFILKDVSLTGGTTLTLSGNIDADKLEAGLKEKLSDVSFRKLSDIRTGQTIALVIETPIKPEELKPIVEQILGYTLNEENSSIEFSGSSLSQGFYSELLKIVFISFILMGFVVFMIFGESFIFKVISLILSLSAVKLTFPSKTGITILIGLVGFSALTYSLIKSKNKNEKIYSLLAGAALLLTLVFPNYYFIFPIFIILLGIYLITSTPSIAVIFAAFADIVMAITLVNLLGMKISAAGLAAFLMLIGYSVDTDILLTTRALKNREGTLNKRIYSAFKTGIFMTLTALAAVLPVFFIVSGLPDSFRQIFLILAIGLAADIINTWMTNVGIIKWYCQRRKIE